MTQLKWILVVGLGLLGCQTAGPSTPPETKTAPVKVAQKTEAKTPEIKEAKPAPKPKVAVQKKTPTPKAHKPGKAPIKWAGPVKWVSWADALVQAKKQNKPICLIVYADWCPRCKELAPAFSRPEIAKLAGSLIMVHQNSDERPAWLEELKVLGSYVPRVFFFSPDGSLRDDITSGHPRYPYFYTPKGLDALKKSMQTVVN